MAGGRGGAGGAAIRTRQLYKLGMWFEEGARGGEGCGNYQAWGKLFDIRQQLAAGMGKGVEGARWKGSRSPVVARK